MGRSTAPARTTRTAIFGMALILANLALARAAHATDADGNGIDDAAESALARRFCPALALHGPDTALHPITVPVYPVPVEIMGLGGATPGEGLTADRLFVLWQAQPYDYPYGDHWVRAQGWSPPLPESDPAHDYSALRDDPPERRETAPPAQPSHIYNLRFHWEYGNPDINEPHEWYAVWENGNAWSRPGSVFPPTVYAHLRRCENSGCASPPGSIFIQYWFFFPFNDWVNNHEGDWEGINVIASSEDPATATLLDVEFFAHRVNLTRGAVQLTEHCLILDATHPIAFIGGHGYEQGCAGGAGEGEASHGFYPTAGRFEAVGEGDFLGCFDRTDEEIAVTAGPTIHWSDLEIQVLPDPSAIDTAAEPERAWLAADLLWGTRRVPSVGGELWDDVGNIAPHGPAHNPEGRWGRVAAETATRAYSRPGDAHPRPYLPLDLAWVPSAFFLDSFTGMTRNESGNLGAWTLGTGTWAIAGGALLASGNGTASPTNRATFASIWPPAWYTLPFVAWNERAARFAADMALIEPLPEDAEVGLLVAGAAGTEGEPRVRVVLRRMAGAAYAIETRVRASDSDSLVASAPVPDPGSATHRFEVLTLAPGGGGLFHDVWYDGALLLASVRTPGARDEARGLIVDGAARARFDRVSFSGLRLEPRFRHSPFAAFTAAPASQADIYACAQFLAWAAVDEKSDTGIAAQAVALSTDGGASWQLLLELGGSARSTTWLPPDLPDTRPALLRLTVTDVEGDRRAITSPSFWLHAGTAPAAILTPAGGEEWGRGTVQTIRWSAPCRDAVELRLSTDGGASFHHLIANSEPNDGAFTWAIPGTLPTGNRCRVRILGAQLPPGESPADFAILWDGQLAGGDFEHDEPWSLRPLVARSIGPASHAHGIAAPPLGSALGGQASLFAHTRAEGAGEPGAREASWPPRAEVVLVAESEAVPVSAEIRFLGFRLQEQVAIEEGQSSSGTASATMRLEAVYRDGDGVELAAGEVTSAAVYRNTTGSAVEAQEDVARLPPAPLGAAELAIRLRLEVTSEAYGPVARAEAQAAADDLWFAIPMAVDGAEEALQTAPATIRVDPNPAVAGAPIRIGFSAPLPELLSLRLYDVRGRLVTRLIAPHARAAVWNELHWNPEHLAPGIYFWQLETDSGKLGTRKWVLTR